MAKFRCLSCRAKNPVAEVTPGRNLKIPANDQCAKCGADLREPGLEKLESYPFMAPMNADELEQLDRFTRDRRLQGLELRAQLHERLGRPDEAKRDRLQAVEEQTARAKALASAGNPLLLVAAISWRGETHERAGQRTKAARDKLLVADMYGAQGGEAGAKAAVAAAPLTIAIGGMGFGLEWADAARAGAKNFNLKQARGFREGLIADGRAIGIGLCEKCGGEVEVTADGRCPKHHKVTERRFVVPEDVDAARAELTGSARPPDRPPP